MKRFETKNILGFSLIELAIALTIIAVLLSVSIAAFSTQLKSTSLLASETKLEENRSALQEYFDRAGKFPCPADASLASGDTNFGVAAASCDSSCPSGLVCSGLMASGDFPFKTFGLTSESIKDGYGNKILYAVDRRFTRDSGGYCEAGGKLTVQDYNNNTVSSEAAYVLVSHGEDEAGARAFDTGGVKKNCNTTYKDGENCDGDAIFRISDIKLNAVTATNYYDDIVTWGVNANRKICPAGLNKCFAWFDAADMCSMEMGSGTDLYKWYDKAENTFDRMLRQNTTSNRPSILTNGPKGLSYVRFDGINDLMTAGNTGAFPQTDFTSMVVFRNTTTTGTMSAITNHPSYAGAPGQFFRMAGSNVSARLVYDSEYTSSGVTMNNGLPHFMSMDIAPNSPLSFYTDGEYTVSSTMTSGASFSNTALVVGGSSSEGGYYTGDILEVLYFTPKLTRYELDLVHDYLKEKWQL